MSNMGMSTMVTGDQLRTRAYAKLQEIHCEMVPQIIAGIARIGDHSMGENLEP